MFEIFFLCAGISVNIKGEANTYWTTDKQEMDERGQYRDETQTVTAHEEYFESKYYLVGSASGNVGLLVCLRVRFFSAQRLPEINGARNRSD